MTVRVLPDTEAIAVEYLKTVPELAALIGERLGTTLDLTEDTDLPALRLTRVGSQLIARRHFRGNSIQLEGWATTELDAQDVCETAYAALFERDFVAAWPGLGVVTGVASASGPRTLPDPDTKTPRWVATVIVYAHPLPE